MFRHRVKYVQFSSELLFSILLCCAGGYKIFDDLYYVNEEFQKMLNYINTIQTRLFHIFTILQDIIMQTSFGV